MLGQELVASLIACLAETAPTARERLFQQWLCLSLRKQWADLNDYLRDGRGDSDTRLWWKHYRKLIPASATYAEQRLFMCDIQAVLATIRDERAYSSEHGLRDVFQQVGRDLGTNLKVIGAALGVSARELGAQFRMRTGLTFHRYLCLERVRHAVEVLLDRECRQQEVALLAGYTDPSNLIRDFRKVLGTTPDRFRRELLVVNAKPRRARLPASTAPG